MWKRYLTLMAMLFVGISAPQGYCKDPATQPIYKYADWKEVESFTGEATAIDHGWTKKSDSQGWTDGDRYLSARYTFDLTRKAPSKSAPRNAWSWDVENCKAQGNVIEHSNGEGFLAFFRQHYSGSFSGPVKKDGSLSINFETGRWQILTGSFLEKPFDESGHIYGIHNGKVDNDSDLHMPENKIPGIFINGNLEGAVRPGVLSGSAVQEDEVPPNATHSRREYRVTLWPKYRDVECVVEIDKYDSWLPAANINIPSLPGSWMLVKAYLQPKGGGTNARLRARLFKFDLSAVSHEPGVAMNYPILTSGKGGNVPDDPHPDLRLGLYGQTGEIRDDGQEILADSVVNLRGQDSASVFVDAFDFGGYANMQVKCELEDGREIAGVFHDKGEDIVDITLPKRSQGSKIADVWRQKYNLGPNDAEDYDDDPVADSNKGDGFSNYEEYRGFVVNGIHMRTDPTIKDIFIKNRLGPTAQRGINLFASDTMLKTHPKCSDLDMPPSRIMNQNRSSQSPTYSHEYQHGLVLVWQLTGSYSYADVKDVLWRPKNVPEVKILRSVAFPTGLAKSQKEWADTELAVTIAHELCHAIGVPHHGETDPGMKVWVRRTFTAEGQTAWWFEEHKAYWDDSAKKYKSLDGLGTEIRIFNALDSEISARDPGKMKFPFFVWVGMYGGQHSGNLDCIMRYDCAGAYIIPDRPDARFMVFNEPTGTGLCDAAAGTGFNAPEQNPPYFSNSTKGNCVHRFAVRDDAPLKEPK